jgi:hypothetical protein
MGQVYEVSIVTVHFLITSVTNLIKF